tara:strand:+ start:234 stop:869 length:636 start_codon:yes stop_codon:yes gene_type:complete
MNKLLKDALEMSKTKLLSYPENPNPMRRWYKQDYHSLSLTLEKLINALDFEYKVSMAKGGTTHRYLQLMDEFDKYLKRLKETYARYQAEPKENSWHTTRNQVLEAYENYSEAYEFLRNQMAIVKVSEDKKFKYYLYRNYGIAKPKNGGKYFAYPNLKMSWYGFENSMPKDFWHFEAETLYEIKYEIDKIVMSIFSKESNLTEFSDSNKEEA